MNQSALDHAIQSIRIYGRLKTKPIIGLIGLDAAK
jgi:hypothetical protein